MTFSQLIGELWNLIKDHPTALMAVAGAVASTGGWLFSALMTTMPPLSPDATYKQRWAHDFFQFLAANNPHRVNLATPGLYAGPGAPTQQSVSVSVPLDKMPAVEAATGAASTASAGGSLTPTPAAASAPTAAPAPAIAPVAAPAPSVLSSETPAPAPVAEAPHIHMAGTIGS